MKTYEVHVDRDELGWRVRVPAVERSTAARHLREVEVMARDLIAIMTETEPDSFELDVHVELPESVRRHLDEAARLREESAQANRKAAEESRAAARELVDQGLPMRDAGELLGVSHQRVAQLVS